MSHATAIVLQSHTLNNQAIINRYLSMIDDMLKQMRARKIDIAVTTIIENVSNVVKFDLIDNLVNFYILTREDGTTTDFESYTKELLAQFSVNEQLCILAHTNLPPTSNAIEDITALLALNFYDNIYSALIQRSANNGAILH